MDTKTPDQQPESEPRQGTLFDMPERDSPTSAPAKPACGGIPRLRRANRHQVVFRALALDQMLPEFYRERGWDENGVPTPEKLTTLGLGDE